MTKRPTPRDSLQNIGGYVAGHQGSGNGGRYRSHCQQLGHLPVDPSCPGMSHHSRGEPKHLCDEGHADGNLWFKTERQDEQRRKESSAADSSAICNCRDEDGDGQQEPIGEIHDRVTLVRVQLWSLSNHFGGRNLRSVGAGGAPQSCRLGEKAK